MQHIGIEMELLTSKLARPRRQARYTNALDVMIRLDLFGTNGNIVLYFNPCFDTKTLVLILLNTMINGQWERRKIQWLRL